MARKEFDILIVGASTIGILVRSPAIARGDIEPLIGMRDPPLRSI